MSTFQEMRLEIADHIDDDSIDDQIGKAIKRAIRHFERVRFYFNQKTFTFNTVANQASYSLSDAADIATFLHVDSAYVTSSGYRYPFVQIDYPTLDGMQNGTTTGRPTTWAYFGQKIWTYPIPDAVYEATISCHYRLTELSGDNDTNAWTTDGQDLIMARAEKLLAIGTTHNAEDAVAASALEMEYLDALLYETQLRRGRQFLRVDPALVSCQPYDIQTG